MTEISTMVQVALSQVWETYKKHGKVGASIQCTLEPGDMETITSAGEVWTRKTSETEWKRVK